MDTAWCRVMEAVAMETKGGECVLLLIFGCPSDTFDVCVGPNSRSGANY